MRELPVKRSTNDGCGSVRCEDTLGMVALRSIARSRQVSRPSRFFFSSRRRHTRFDCDWSSDVCSSDLFKGVKTVAGIGNDYSYGHDCWESYQAVLKKYTPDVKFVLELFPKLGVTDFTSHIVAIQQSKADLLMCSFWSGDARSEEHTSELQSQSNLVCRLLLEQKAVRVCSREVGHRRLQPRRRHRARARGDHGERRRTRRRAGERHDRRAARHDPGSGERDRLA